MTRTLNQPGGPFKEGINTSLKLSQRVSSASPGILQDGMFLRPFTTIYVPQHHLLMILRSVHDKRNPFNSKEG